jgi:hypothetical protein
MKAPNLILILIISFSVLNCKTSKQDEFPPKVLREYLVHNIDSTNRYYLLQTTFQNDSVHLVIYKKSEQLKKQNINIGNYCNFRTYNRLDVIPNIDYFHEVDGIEVWDGFKNNQFSLHFTDGMGNGYLESIEEISDSIPN